MEPQVGVVTIEPGDKFMICSDGVVDGLFYSQIEDILRSASSDGLTPAQKLVAKAVMHSGRDNTTAVAVQVV